MSASTSSTNLQDKLYGSRSFTSISPEESEREGLEEKEFGPIHAYGTKFKPIKSAPTPAPSCLQRQKSTQTIRSSRSFACGDGYTLFSEDVERDVVSGVEAITDPEKAFEVSWDGDGDPMNPRSR